jgi:hypothetical protein
MEAADALSVVSIAIRLRLSQPRETILAGTRLHTTARCFLFPSYSKLHTPTNRACADSYDSNPGWETSIGFGRCVAVSLSSRWMEARGGRIQGMGAWWAEMVMGTSSVEDLRRMGGETR